MLSQDFPIGSLVLYNRRLARVKEITHDCYLGLEYLHNKATYSSYRGESCVMISKEPPPPIPVGTKLIPLPDRRDNLISNLQNARRNTRNTVEQRLLDVFNGMLSGQGVAHRHQWWWHLVAESVDDPRKISFAPSMETADNETRRRFCSVKKFLQIAGRYGSRMDEEEAELLGNLIGTHFPDTNEYSFEIVRGLDAFEAYKNSNPQWGSCMTGQSSTRWYARNPDTVGVVKILRGKLYSGRALIWTSTEQTMVVDRVYPSNKGPHTAALHKWCQANGYDYKTSQSMSDNCLKSGKNHHFNMHCTSNEVWNKNDHGFPYLDTMKYARKNPRTNEEIVLQVEPASIRFDSTGGGFTGYGEHGDVEDEHRTQCAECGVGMNIDDSYTADNGQPLCRECYHNLYVEVAVLNGHTIVRWEIIPRDDADCCERCDLYFHDDNITYVDETAYCSRCVREVAAPCIVCDELTHKEDLKTFANVQFCEHCQRTCAHCDAVLPVLPSYLCPCQNPEKETTHEPTPVLELAPA